MQVDYSYIRGRSVPAMMLLSSNTQAIIMTIIVGLEKGNKTLKKQPWILSCKKYPAVIVNWFCLIKSGFDAMGHGNPYKVYGQKMACGH